VQLRFLVLALALVVTACSNGNGGDSFPNKITPKVLPDGDTVLRRGNGAEPETLDPHRAQSVGAANILRDLYEGLISKKPDGTLEPGGAVRWDISEDRTTYTFHLREDAVWSNGEPVTAGDYAYGLRRTVDPATGSPYAQILAPVVNAEAIIEGNKPPSALGVEVVDEQTLRIRLVSPTPYFLGMLTHSSTYPAYKPAIEAHGDAFTQPGNAVTNGAYKMAKWRVNSLIALEKNPKYWDADNVSIDRVEYYPIENAESELKRYQAGELDWTSQVPTPQIDRVKRHISDQLKTHPSLGVYYYGFNVTRPPFEDAPKLRRALSMAIDRKVIVEKITRGGQIPAYGWVPPAVDDYEGARFDYADWSEDKRIEQAKRLYREAGYSEDNPLEVEIRYNTSEGHKKIATVIANMWKTRLGVDVTLLNEEWKVFLQNVREQEVTQIFRAGWIGDYNDPYTFLELMHSDFGLNGSGYASAQYDALLEKASRLPGGEARQKLLREAEAQLLSDHPVMPVYFYTSMSLMKPYVKGFRGNPMGHYYSKDLRIEPSGEG